MPKISPRRPIAAFKSPPAILIISLVGQPKNTKAPTIINNPNKNLMIVEEPPLGLNSLKIIEVIKDPKTIPIISGLKYWTTKAL